GAPLYQGAGRDRRRHRPHASRRGPRRAHGRHLLRLGSGAHRYLRRAARRECRHARPCAERRRGAAGAGVRMLYTLVLHLALPFVLLRLWWRGRTEPGYREAVSERFGYYDTDRFERLIWLHAVSVGEARAA